VARAAAISPLLFQSGRPFVDAQLRHPTVIALTEGQLEDSVAKSWLEQDYLFLIEEVRVLSRLTWQAPPAHQESLVEMTCNVVHREIPNHKKLAAVFGADLENASLGAPGRAYTKWLLEAAADYGAGLTAILSGLWGYSTLGKEMGMPMEPRLRQWVETYKDPEFPPLAERFARMVDETGVDPDTALTVFLTGMAHEVAFWDAP
jgi:thiaminase (transcriptional activator TenA)